MLLKPAAMREPPGLTMESAFINKLHASRAPTRAMDALASEDGTCTDLDCRQLIRSWATGHDLATVATLLTTSSGRLHRVGG